MSDRQASPALPPGPPPAADATLPAAPAAATPGPGAVPGYEIEAELGRFRREAEAIGRLQHPHIVQVHEVGEHDGLPFFSLEFCPGGSLEKKLAGTPLPPREAAALAEVLARALDAAHRKGIVHRDL